MPVEALESTPAARKLVAEWTKAKLDERKANATRLDIESKLYKLYEAQIPEKGTVRVENLKISCGFTDKWDQDTLQDIRANWPDELPPFPFREELKPDGKAISYLKENMVEAYLRIEPALTQDPKKPSFSID
jgi:hypothetical protein